MSAEIVNMGCRLNIHEGEVIRQHTAGQSDLIVVNSCAVTNEAVRSTRQTLRRLRRERPDATIAVTGCAAQIDPASFAGMPEVDRVIGNADKLMPEAWSAEGARAENRISDIMSVTETAPHLVPAMDANTRGFVEVQNGCDHRCTFCIIPYGRGNSRSVPAGRVIERVQALTQSGHREVVLTGVDLTSYGPDLPGNPTLGSLIARILKHVPTLERLRISSIDSIEADETLIDLITNEPRIMPHLHLSLQAGDNMILKRMKRRHDRDQAIRFVDTVKSRRPDIAIGADIIAGFPTETDEMFENSLKLVDECDIVFGHIFPYSARTGTPAAKMPQVPMPVRKARAKVLREACARRRDKWFDTLVGTEQTVLAEKGGQGHTDHFAPVRFPSEAVPGEIVTAKIAGHAEGRLLATA